MSIIYFFQIVNLIAQTAVSKVDFPAMYVIQDFIDIPTIMMAFPVLVSGTKSFRSEQGTLKNIEK